MLTREQRADWRLWQRLAGRVLVLNEYMAKHLPAQDTLAIVDRHLQALEAEVEHLQGIIHDNALRVARLEAEHAAAVALRANNDAHFACDDMTDLATIAERNRPLYRAWREAVEKIENGGSNRT